MFNGDLMGFYGDFMVFHLRFFNGLIGMIFLDYGWFMVIYGDLWFMDVCGESTMVNLT